MPSFLRKIEGEIIPTNIGVISNQRLIEGSVGVGDYYRFPHFIAYLVYLPQNSVVTTLETPDSFGMKNNTTFEELNISY